MKVAIMQPYFYPYLGYYQLISECDVFIFLDDVNFIRKGFIHRNFINLVGEKTQINLRLVKASQNKKINELQISDSISDFKSRVEVAYKKSRYWQDVAQILDKHATGKNSLLSEFLIDININLISRLGIDVKILKSSEIELDFFGLRGEERIIELTKAIGGTSYINLPGGKSLYSDETFSENSIGLEFVVPRLKLNGEVENSYSIIDCVAHHGFDELNNWFSMKSLA